MLHGLAAKKKPGKLHTNINSLCIEKINIVNRVDFSPALSIVHINRHQILFLRWVHKFFQNGNDIFSFPWI